VPLIGTSSGVPRMTTTIPRASAILGAARTLAAKLLLAVPIDRAALSEAMTESAGGNDAAGAWQQRDSFEALEVALCDGHSRTCRPNGRWRCDQHARGAGQGSTRPTQCAARARSQFQQFSTPPALAYLAVHLARLSSDDVFLEPSAGTGIIASLAKGAAKQCPDAQRTRTNPRGPARGRVSGHEGLPPRRRQDRVASVKVV
jgi:hypothetical protein